jgi:hypothetical protein
MNRVSHFSHEETFMEEVERSTTLGDNQKVEVLILYHQATRKCIQSFIDLTRRELNKVTEEQVQSAQSKIQ